MSWTAPHFLALTALVTILYQSSFFFIAAGLRIDKVTDFAGTTNFVLLALLTLFLKGAFSPIQVALTALVCVWGFRLALFLLIRILIWGEDRRFDDTRNDIVKFATFWIFQALWVWTVSLPVTLINASDTAFSSLGAIEIFGICIWATGFVTETVADLQKLLLKKEASTAPSSGPASQEGVAESARVPWCHVGLWKWSRHPNYFGEILLWLGVFVASAPLLSTMPWQLLTAAGSPLFTASILLFLSGIPILESSADKKYGAREDYQKYKEQTSVLIPIAPSIYSPLPKWVKTWIFLDLPMYNTERALNDHDSPHAKLLKP